MPKEEVKAEEPATTEVSPYHSFIHHFALFTRHFPIQVPAVANHTAEPSATEVTPAAEPAKEDVKEEAKGESEPVS